MPWNMDGSAQDAGWTGLNALARAHSGSKRLRSLIVVLPPVPRCAHVWQPTKANAHCTAGAWTGCALGWVSQFKRAIMVYWDTMLAGMGFACITGLQQFCIPVLRCLAAPVGTGCATTGAHLSRVRRSDLLGIAPHLQRFGVAVPGLRCRISHTFAGVDPPGWMAPPLPHTYSHTPHLPHTQRHHTFLWDGWNACGSPRSVLRCCRSTALHRRLVCICRT